MRLSDALMEAFGEIDEEMLKASEETKISYLLWFKRIGASVAVIFLLLVVVNPFLFSKNLTSGGAKESVAEEVTESTIENVDNASAEMSIGEESFLLSDAVKEIVENKSDEVIQVSILIQKDGNDISLEEVEKEAKRLVDSGYLVEVKEDKLYLKIVAKEILGIEEVEGYQYIVNLEEESHE
ncbi:MAG: hypothetical protein IJ875_00610 [Solobacterium sp.]|nr:hypothetical protein [Solobacterium sp.]